MVNISIDTCKTSVYNNNNTLLGTCEQEKKFAFKDIYSLNIKNELFNELESYGCRERIEGYSKICNKLAEYRNYIANNDKNSNVPDGHIGTFCQDTGNQNCSFLSALATIPDEDINKILKIDEFGNALVTFPGDKSHKTIELTNEEIEKREIKINDEIYNKFSTGDLDVTILEMAIIKRFGRDVYKRGFSRFTKVSDVVDLKGSANLVRALIYPNAESKYIFDITEKDLQNIQPGTYIKVLSNMERVRDGIDTPLEENQIMKLKDDTILFDDGVISLQDNSLLLPAHAYSVVKYDSKEKVLYVSDPFNNTSAIKVPLSVIKYMNLVQ